MELSKQNSNSKESLNTFSPEETPTPVSAHHPDITMATRQTEVSSKYQDIISKSVLISSGPPAVYQLKPKKEKIETLTRFTVGKKDLNKTNRTILLVGETGAGKSTLINALVNYAMGVKWEDDIWFQMVEEEKKRQSESQTPDVIVYQIFGLEGETLPYSLTIIDTPGFGDTRGIEHDDAISERLLEWFCSNDGVHEINAVGLVLATSVNRLSDRMRYIFESVVSLFGKNMEKNIVALVTHSNGLIPENVLQALEDANIKCAKGEDNEPLHFMFDNCQSKEKTKKTKVALKSAWDITTEGLSQFTDFLVSAAPQKMMMTVHVLTERKILKANIQNLKDKTEFIEVQQREVEQTEEALKKHEQKMEKNENFNVEVDEPYKEKENIKSGYHGFLCLDYIAATSCKVCKETCHYPCTKSWYAKNCSVMENGHCTICTNKCPASKHVKEKWTYVIKTRKVKKTMEDLKEKYEKNKEGHKNKLTLLQSVRMKMEELQRERDKVLEEAFGHVEKLEQIALKVDSLSTLVHLDFLIERMKERGDTEKIQILKEMKSRVDDRARAAAQYKQAACGKAAEK